MKIDAPSAWTASTIGARRMTFARVSTHVIPGDVRPSGKMHDEPCTMSPTPCQRVLDEVDRVALGDVVAVARAFEHRRAVEPVADRRPADRDRRFED